MAKNEFALSVAKFAKQFEDGAEQAIRGTTIKLWDAIIKSSPVDTGRFRGNWFATGQQPSTRVDVTVTDRTGDRASNAAQAKVLSIKDYSTFTLTNNLPYAERLEFGWSNQAPAGFVRVNIARFNTLLEQEAKKDLPK